MPSHAAHWMSVSMFILMTPFLRASSILSFSEPDPPWNTKLTGLSSLHLSCSLMYSCALPRISGRSTTLPALYTPCTLPKAAAMVNWASLTAESALTTCQISSGCEYMEALSMSSLLTPSSSPPVMPSSISRRQSILAMRCMYLTQVAMFSSRGSSERSSMCDEKRGSPFFLWYSSSAASMPSNQGRSFLAQWSEWRTTGTP
mmetsp:Transcript_30411/g.59404  ORF Transcript_30411/g.59404 Transcript_30411/m.59404 type:complete len:202 (-) Transcript_30411:450-1055(-)